MGIDSPAPQGQRIVVVWMLISAIVAAIGYWLRWIEKGQEESIRRTHEIRRICISPIADLRVEKLLQKIQRVQSGLKRQSAAAYIAETAAKKKWVREESFDSVLQAEIAKLKASNRG